MKHQTRNDLALGPDGVWQLATPREFRYSEGSAVERHLEQALESVHDRSSSSVELEGWIRDWPSQYHLSSARANLLRPFEFDPQARVLEVGCGCGAITRFLGETFRSVVSVEGSEKRARLARLRTRDLEHVQVICAPLQELEFTAPFDLVVCVGVLEYASLYEHSPDPHAAILGHLRAQLADGGALLLAIENQFGLKYFTSAPEDHTGVPFDGIEGYPRFADRARTFGLPELRQRVLEHFAHVEEYFPYPDYKLPQCVVSARGLERLGAGELIGAFSRAPHGEGARAFDQRLTLLELERNGQLAFFANSLLLVAGDAEPLSVRMPALGTMFSTRRPPNTQTVTRIHEPVPGELRVTKRLTSGSDAFQDGKLTLRGVEGAWIHGHSLDTELRPLTLRRDWTLQQVFAPCRAWLEALPAHAGSDGVALVDGDYVDALWRNSYPRQKTCEFIDLEWVWHAPVRRNALVLRSVYWFVEGLHGMRGLDPRLTRGSFWRRAREIARTLGLRLDAQDYAEFLEIEAEFARVNKGIAAARTRAVLKLATRLPSAYAALTGTRRLMTRLRARLRRLSG